MIVAFTGHRPPQIGGYIIPNPTYTYILFSLRALLKDLKPSHAISGMALGVDQWAAGQCVRLDIPFVAALPFFQQDCKWPLKSRKDYGKLLKKASAVEYISTGEYTPEKMQTRNRWMVDHSDALIAVYDGSLGGTRETYYYAYAQGKTIYKICPKHHLIYKVRSADGVVEQSVQLYSSDNVKNGKLIYPTGKKKETWYDKSRYEDNENDPVSD